MQNLMLLTASKQILYFALENQTDIIKIEEESEKERYLHAA